MNLTFNNCTIDTWSENFHWARRIKLINWTKIGLRILFLPAHYSKLEGYSLLVLVRALWEGFTTLLPMMINALREWRAVAWSNLCPCWSELAISKYSCQERVIRMFWIFLHRILYRILQGTWFVH
jgi:hypothetical protein